MCNYSESDLIKIEDFHVLLDNWEVCYLCGENVTWMAATRDHIIPVSKGGHPKRVRGANHYNLVLSHYLCNNIRGNYSIMKTSLYIEYVKKHMGADMFSDIANEIKRLNNNSVMSAFSELIYQKKIYTIENWIKINYDKPWFYNLRINGNQYEYLPTLV